MYLTIKSSDGLIREVEFVQCVSGLLTREEG